MTRAAAVFGALLVATPLVSLLLTAATQPPDALRALAGTVLGDALIQTVALLGGIALLAGALGTATAWAVTAYRFPGSRMLAWLLPLPMAIPTYVTALVYVELLDAAGPVRSALRSTLGREVADLWFPEIRSLTACIALLSFVLYPYVFVAARAAFLARGVASLWAARTLGASPGQAFLKVALPLASRAIAAGLTLALLEALNDVGATEYLGVRTLTVTVYTAWLARGDLAGATQIACVILLAVVALLAAEAIFRRRRNYAVFPAGEHDTPVVVDGWKGSALACACIFPVTIGFGVPCLFLIREVVRRDLVASAGPDFQHHLAVTVGLAAAATALILLWAIPIALGSRAHGSRTERILRFTAGLGYAVPGTVLVLGLFGPLAGVDRILAGEWFDVTGRDPGLLLIGSGAAVVVAYVIRFMRVGIGSLTAQLAGMSPAVEQAARILGAGPLALALRIQLPLLRPALLAAALLIFVDCLKELPATLLLRPLNVETLATLVYGAASRGLFEEGALAALLIVLACLGPVIWLTGAAAPRTERMAITGSVQAALRETPSSATLKAASV